MQYVFLDLLGERVQLLSISAAMILAFKAGRVEKMEYWNINIYICTQASLKTKQHLRT